MNNTYKGIPLSSLAAEGIIIMTPQGKRILNVKAKDLDLFSKSQIRKVVEQKSPYISENSQNFGQRSSAVKVILKDGSEKLMKLKNALKKGLVITT